MSLTRFLDDRPVFFLPSASGLTRWVDYIPVQYDAAATARRFDNDGAHAVDSLLESNAGLTAWVDYTPVFQDGAATVRWSSEATGFIPIIEDGTPSDPSFASVVSLLHMNGADDGTTFTDQSGKVWTAAGTAVTDTAQAKFGTSSMFSDNSGDRITALDTADWEFGSGAFTVELWVRFSAAASCRWISKWNTTGDQRSWRFGYVSGTGIVFGHSTDGIEDVAASGAWTPSNDVWYHVCAMRSGNTIYQFVDGVQMDSDTIGTIFGGTGVPCIGDGPNDGIGIAGWTDEVRVTKGVARYPVTGFQKPVRAFPDA